MKAALISMTAAVFVADKERFLQRVDQGGAPPGVMVAQSRQLDVGAHPSEQIRRGERFDEVVVGAGRQALDRGFLTRASGQQQDRHGGGPRVLAQRREQLETVQPGHHHVADDEVGDSARMASSACWPSVTPLTS